MPPIHPILPIRATGAVLLALAAAPLAAQDAAPANGVALGALIPSDAIRIEVRPDEIHHCATLVAWAFDLPSAADGYGPVLPEVPVGYGPTCAVIPQDGYAPFDRTAQP